jgi:hypothetical protein
VKKVVAVFLMLALLCFFPSSGRAESSAEDDSVYCKSRRRACRMPNVFFVSGSEVYYTDDGVLKMYNIENQTHKSWNIRPDIRKDLLLSTIFFIWAVQDRYNMYFFRMWKSAELLK